VTKKGHPPLFFVTKWILPCFLSLLPHSCAEGATESFPLLMPKVQASPETYLCTPLRLNPDVTYSIVGFKPNASMHTAHHIIVYGCEEPGSDEPVWNCGEMASDASVESQSPCSKGPTIIYAWAKDAPSLDLPQGVGFRVGGQSDVKYLVLQVHYHHVDMIPESGDDSGVELLLSPHPQPRTAGVLLLGTGGYAPAESTTYFETSCQMEDDRIMHPFAFRVHTHGLGKVVSGWRVREGKDWQLLGKKSPQVAQMFYPLEDNSTTIRPGDVVAARCTMVNTHQRSVFIGMTNDDEMCNFYLMYWVEGEETVEPNTCFSMGPPTWSWSSPSGGGLSNIPEVAASTL